MVTDGKCLMQTYLLIDSHTPNLDMQSHLNINILVIWIVMSHARMRSVTNYFIVNLSIADIMNATLNVIPNFTYMLTGNWPFGEYSKYLKIIFKEEMRQEKIT